MAIKTVLPAFPFFVNEDGEALEGGYIFIGMPGFEARSTPKASWFDLAQAIPTGTAAGAAIRTTAGYPRLNGGAANIYVDGDYSMTVTDRNGVVVYAVTTNNVQLGLGLGTVSVLNTGIAAGEVVAGCGRRAANGAGVLQRAGGHLDWLLASGMAATCQGQGGG
jgi:hypothetical protein